MFEFENFLANIILKSNLNKGQFKNGNLDGCGIIKTIDGITYEVKN